MAATSIPAISADPRSARCQPPVLRTKPSGAPGERITVYSSVNPGRAFPLRIVEWAETRKMVWNDGMPLDLFRGVRTYTLTPAGEETTFTMRDQFSGPLLPLIARSMPDLGPSFEQFARGLKAQAEATAAGRRPA